MRSRPSAPSTVATSWAPFQIVPRTTPSGRPSSSSTAQPTTSSTKYSPGASGGSAERGDAHLRQRQRGGGLATVDAGELTR